MWGLKLIREGNTAVSVSKLPFKWCLEELMIHRTYFWQCYFGLHFRWFFVVDLQGISLMIKLSLCYVEDKTLFLLSYENPHCKKKKANRRILKVAKIYWQNCCPTVVTRDTWITDLIYLETILLGAILVSTFWKQTPSSLVEYHFRASCFSWNVLLYLYSLQGLL